MPPRCGRHTEGDFGSESAACHIELGASVNMIFSLPRRFFKWPTVPALGGPFRGRSGIRPKASPLSRSRDARGVSARRIFATLLLPLASLVFEELPALGCN